MPGKDCKKKKGKHTPIVSEAQRDLFGADLARLRDGKKTKTGMSEEELVRHLEESRGKKLVKRVQKKLDRVFKK